MISSAEFEITLMMILVASSCSSLGTLVFLNRQAYIPVSLGKATILGFALGFFYSTSFSSLPLIVFAIIIAMLTLYISKKISGKVGFTLHSISITVASIFFAIGFAIINLFSYIKFTEDERVFTGDLVYSIFNRIIIGGKDYGSISLYILIFITIAVFTTIFIMFNKLKVYTLDKNYAYALGIDMNKVEIILMILISIVVGASIQVAGAFMVSVFILGPVSIAYFFTNRLHTLILASVIVCFIASLTGIRLASYFNVTIVSATVAVIASLFIASVIVAPETGVIRNIFSSSRQRKEIRLKALITYIYLHEAGLPSGKNGIIRHISSVLKWNYGVSSRLIDIAIAKDYINVDDDRILSITSNGKQFALATIKDRHV